jgi:hypothetical protein
MAGKCSLGQIVVETARERSLKKSGKWTVKGTLRDDRGKIAI